MLKTEFRLTLLALLVPTMIFAVPPIEDQGVLIGRIENLGVKDAKRCNIP